MRGADVLACGDYYGVVNADEALPDLKPVVKETTGQAIRRVGRFIQLALIGAGRCLHGHTVSPDTAVYFTSGRGDMEVTVEVMEALFRDGEAPKPLAFINTVSNAACFYIAKHFGFRGRSTFLCNRFAGFETALQLALFDLELGVVASALVGSVDIVTPPLPVHRWRLHLPLDTPVAEASHWVLLRRREGRGGSFIEASEILADRESAIYWAKQRLTDPSATAIAGGQFLSGADLSSIRAETGLSRSFDCRAGRAHYDTQSGAVVSAFIASPEQSLLHVNGAPDGQTAVMLLSKG